MVEDFCCRELHVWKRFAWWRCVPLAHADFEARLSNATLSRIILGFSNSHLRKSSQSVSDSEEVLMIDEHARSNVIVFDREDYSLPGKFTEPSASCSSQNFKIDKPKGKLFTHRRGLWIQALVETSSRTDILGLGSTSQGYCSQPDSFRNSHIRQLKCKKQE